jgi:hypothetical protein
MDGEQVLARTADPELAGIPVVVVVGAERGERAAPASAFV